MWTTPSLEGTITLSTANPSSARLCTDCWRLASSTRQGGLGAKWPNAEEEGRVCMVWFGRGIEDMNIKKRFYAGDCESGAQQCRIYIALKPTPWRSEWNTSRKVLFCTCLQILFNLVHWQLPFGTRGSSRKSLPGPMLFLLGIIFTLLPVQ